MNKAMIRNFIVLLAAIAGIKALYAQAYPKPVTTIPMVQTAPKTDVTIAPEGNRAPITTVPRHTVPIGYVILPPAEYDHDYAGDLTIRIVDTLNELYVLCSQKNSSMLACARRNTQSCLITMVNDKIMRSRGYTTGILLRHEIGHCNGWGADHAGMRPLISSTHIVPESARVWVPIETEQEAARARAKVEGGPK
jgi:hypothetical protein